MTNISNNQTSQRMLMLREIDGGDGTPGREIAFSDTGLTTAAVTHDYAAGDEILAIAFKSTAFRPQA